MTGEARILDNTTTDVIKTWAAVTAATRRIFDTGTELDSVTAADGTVDLKVVCRNLALVGSVAEYFPFHSLDTAGPDQPAAPTGCRRYIQTPPT